MSKLSKQTLEYLAELARLELKEKKEEKLIKNLQEILAYFEELKEADTENVEPLAGGTVEKNIFRNDDETFVGRRTSPVFLRGQFPEEENGYLKIPPVFE